MTPVEEKGFSLASDVTKQIITLSSGILGVSVTFLTKSAFTSLDQKILATISWSFFVISILVGILLLLKFTGELAQQGPATGSIWNKQIRALALIQQCTFFVAIVCTFIFGILQIF